MIEHKETAINETEFNQVCNFWKEYTNGNKKNLSEYICYNIEQGKYTRKTIAKRIAVIILMHNEPNDWQGKELPYVGKTYCIDNDEDFMLAKSQGHIKKLMRYVFSAVCDCVNNKY